MNKFTYLCNFRRIQYLAIAILFFTAGCDRQDESVDAEHIQLPATAGDFAFVNVTVIPMDTERVVNDQTVVISEGRITHIEPADSIHLAPEVTVIDGDGKFLVPGLADMHVHIWSDKEPPLYVAKGVTTVRNMWGAESTLKLREDINAGHVLGPTMITAGPLVDGSPRIWEGSVEVDDPEEAREIVREQQAAGYDFIKVYSNLSPEVFHAIADEAKKLGIPFAGHIPRSMEAADAMRAGMATVEHLTGHKAASTNAGYSVGNGFRSQEMKDIADSVSAGEITMGDVFSNEKMQELGEIAKESGTWHSATLVVLDRIFLTPEQSEAHFARPEMRYISPAIRSFWNPANDFRRKDVSEEAMLAMQQFHEVDQQQVAAFHATGTGIIAGTDAPNPFVLHGFAIYEELAFLEQAGLSRFEAIAAATRNPAQFLQVEGEFGTVREGARADLILLDANPLEDLNNFESRQGVMLRGQWLPEEELLAALEAVAASYESPEWFADREPLQFEPGESPVFSAEFTLMVGDQNMGGERLAVIRKDDGAQVIVAQNVSTLGLLETSGGYRVEADSDGLLQQYVYSTATDLVSSGGSISKQDDGYLFSAGESDEVVTGDARVLPNTLADWFLMASDFAGLGIGESMSLDVIAPAFGAPGTPQSQTWTIARQGNAVDKSETGMTEMFVYEVSMDFGETTMTGMVRMDSGDGSLLSLEVTSQMGTISYQRTR
jgi:imidazolonepropionase-like amidohydrolase